MKKLTALILALVMILSFAACANKQQPEEQTGTAGLGEDNVTKYESLEELNEASGVLFAKPTVMGVSDEYFQKIDGEPEIFEYGFKVNGVEFDVRFCEEYAPAISGVYKDGKDVFEGAEPGESFKYYDDCKLYRFCLIFGQYIITAFDNGTYTEEQFGDICSEMRALMTPAEP